MRPDRAVVVGGRVEALLARAQRAQAPAGEEVAAEELLRDARGALGAADAGEEELACVGAAHVAGPLVAVERERVGADVLAPEGGLEACAQLLGLLFELRGERALAAVGG